MANVSRGTACVCSLHLLSAAAEQAPDTPLGPLLFGAAFPEAIPWPSPDLTRWSEGLMDPQLSYTAKALCHPGHTASYSAG